MGGLLGGGQRVCWPPSQIIGGGGAAPPLPTPMISSVTSNGLASRARRKHTVVLKILNSQLNQRLVCTKHGLTQKNRYKI